MYIQEHSLSKFNELRNIRRSDCVREDGTLRFPDVFFIHTFHSNILEEHHWHKGYDASKWKEWWNEGRIYILDANKIKDL